MISHLIHEGFYRRLIEVPEEAGQATAGFDFHLTIQHMHEGLRGIVHADFVFGSAIDQFDARGLQPKRFPAVRTLCRHTAGEQRSLIFPLESEQGRTGDINIRTAGKGEFHLA